MSYYVIGITSYAIGELMGLIFTLLEKTAPNRVPALIMFILCFKLLGLSLIAIGIKEAK